MTSTDRLLFTLACAVCLVVGAVTLALAVATAGLTSLLVLGWK